MSFYPSKLRPGDPVGICYSKAEGCRWVHHGTAIEPDGTIVVEGDGYYEPDGQEIDSFGPCRSWLVEPDSLGYAGSLPGEIEILCDKLATAAYGLPLGRLEQLLGKLRRVADELGVDLHAEDDDAAVPPQTIELGPTAFRVDVAEPTPPPPAERTRKTPKATRRQGSLF
jgi:hypothetical protein